MKPEERDKLIADAMKAGLSRNDASVMVDISKHAFEQGVEAMMRILETIPSNSVRNGAFASALASCAGILQEHFPEHWKALVEAGGKISEPTVIVLPGQG